MPLLRVSKGFLILEKISVRSCVFLVSHQLWSEVDSQFLRHCILVLWSCLYPFLYYYVFFGFLWVEFWKRLLSFNLNGFEPTVRLLNEWLVIPILVIIQVQSHKAFPAPTLELKELKLLWLIFFKRPLFIIFTAWLGLNCHITIVRFCYLGQVSLLGISTGLFSHALSFNLVNYYSLLGVIVLS